MPLSEEERNLVMESIKCTSFEALILILGKVSPPIEQEKKSLAAIIENDLLDLP